MNAKISFFGNIRLMKLVMIGLFALDSSVVYAQNQSSAMPRDDKAVYAAIEEVPARARVKTNPVESDPNALAAGGKLYEQHCAECHGMKAEGTKRGPSLLKEPVQRATQGALFWVLSNGVIRHGMPDWSKLPEPERWQIITFLKSFKASLVPHSTTSPQ